MKNIQYKIQKYISKYRNNPTENNRLKKEYYCAVDFAYYYIFLYL